MKIYLLILSVLSAFSAQSSSYGDYDEPLTNNWIAESLKESLSDNRISNECRNDFVRALNSSFRIKRKTKYQLSKRGMCALIKCVCFNLSY